MKKYFVLLVLILCTGCVEKERVARNPNAGVAGGFGGAESGINPGLNPDPIAHEVPQ